jgi:hypothetical protein
MARISEALRKYREHDLLASGLSLGVVKRLRIGEVMDEEAAYELTGIEGVFAYEIPYFDVSGEPTQFSRWKLLPADPDREVDIKYWQPERTISRVYIPPLVNWSKISQDPSVRIVVTEGEKKAACATLHDIPCIGLGGVWSWKAKKWGMEDLPDFGDFLWHGREVEICFDSDLYTNSNVSRALRALCVMLTNAGARVFVRYLPNAKGKTDLDSFLVAFGAEAYEDLECHESDTSRELHDLNADLVYVKNPGMYYSTRERIVYGTTQRLLMRYGHIAVLDGGGKPHRAVSLWAEWPHRRMAEGMVYDPAKPQMTGGCVNTWKGWGVEPRQGPVQKWLEVIKSVDGWEWFLRWLAFPIQNPGVKMFTSVLLWSLEQGTGKTFIGNVMRDIYGDNSVEIGSGALHDDSYVWLKNKQFVLAEEVSYSGVRADNGRLKNLITGERVLVNEKYVPQYELSNRANILFTSNRPDALPLDRDDRRIFVATMSKKRPDEFWDELDHWRHHGGGPSFFMWYLLHKVDVSGFNPRDRAPVTDAKMDMVYDSMSSVEALLYDLISNETLDEMLGDMAKVANGRDVWTVQQITTFLPDEVRTRSVAPKAIGMALVKAGAVRGGVIKTATGPKRLIAVRNISFWRERVSDKRLWAANFEGKMTVADFSKRRSER